MSRTFTDGQWVDFWAKVQSGAITQEVFQAFLDAASRPNRKGLSETFEVQVDGRTVTCAWIPANYFAANPSNQEVIDETARRRLTSPSREVAIAAFDAKKDEMAANPSVAIDGVVLAGANGFKVVGCVCEDRGGRHSDLYRLLHRWLRHDRFLVVVSE